jgi:hypothetical protein
MLLLNKDLPSKFSVNKLSNNGSSLRRRRKHLKKMKTKINNDKAAFNERTPKQSPATGPPARIPVGQRANTEEGQRFSNYSLKRLRI